jgi:anaerobic selenocysteine-containing dehydrogenase
VIKGEEPYEPTEAPLAYETAYAATNNRLSDARKIAVMVSPMLSCEDAYLIATWASGFDAEIVWAIGPVPVHGDDKTFHDGFRLYAEKAPNARGVRRVLEKFGDVLDYEAFVKTLKADNAIDAAVLTGNYPSDWVTDDLVSSIGERFIALIDTLPNRMTERADVLLPGATWAEKSGTFENAQNRLQAFDRAIPPLDYCKSEAQIALDLIAMREAVAPEGYNPANTRQKMASTHGMSEMVRETHLAGEQQFVASDMEVVEL